MSAPAGRPGCVVPKLYYPGDAAACVTSCWQERAGKGHCRAEADLNYEALVSKLRRAHRMSVSDPTDRARATLYGAAADAITALIGELGARA